MATRDLPDLYFVNVTGPLIIIQARMASTRLPNKVMADICGKPMLEHVLMRCLITGYKVVLATTDKLEDQRLANFAKRHGIGAYQGSELDVLDRYYRTVNEFGASTIVRITGDCPLIDPKLIQAAVQYFFIGDFDYVTTRPGYPDGMDAEVFSFGALERAWREAMHPEERAHVTAYFTDDRFKVGRMRPDAATAVKLSVDTQEDLERIRRIVGELGENCSLEDVTTPQP